MIMAVWTGCGEKIGEGSYNFVSPDGAPLLAVADFWDDGESFAPAEIKYEITAESNLLQKFQKGDDAFIMAPVNVGANIHKSFEAGKTGTDYKLLNVTSWGVVYIATTDSSLKTREESDTLEEFLSQFSGKTMPTIGRAAIPGKTLEYVMTNKNIDCELSGSDATAIQQSFVKGEVTTALFAEPAITAVKSKAPALRALCSLGGIYKEITGNDFPMAGCFVRADIAESNAGLVKAVDSAMKASVEAFAADPQAAGEKAKTAGGTLPPAVVASAAARMNVKYKSAEESKDDVLALLSALQQPAEESLFVKY